MGLPSPAAVSSARQLARYWPQAVCPEAAWAQTFDGLDSDATAILISAARAMPAPPFPEQLAAISRTLNHPAAIPGLRACRAALAAAGTRGSAAA